MEMQEGDTRYLITFVHEDEWLVSKYVYESYRLAYKAGLEFYGANGYEWALLRVVATIDPKLDMVETK